MDPAVTITPDSSSPVTITPDGNAPGTVTGSVANISAGTGQTDPYHKFQGSFLDRATSQFGQDLQNPSNFLPSVHSLLGAPGIAYDMIKQGYQQWQNRNQPQGDPAEAIGHLGVPALGALVTHVADAIPGPSSALKPQLGTGTYMDPASALALLRQKGLPTAQSGEALAGLPATRPAAAPTEPAAIAADRYQVVNLSPKSTAGGPMTPSGRPLTPEELHVQAQLGTTGVSPTIGNWQPPPELGVSSIGDLEKRISANRAKMGELPRGGTQSQPVPLPQPMRTPSAQGPPANLPPMESSPSTTIVQHGYDEPSRRMVIQFKNGNIYEYKGVPPEVYKSYQQSESHGSFHASNIKGRYETNKIGQVPVQGTAGARVRQSLGGQQ
jgi:hypothetical protein